MTRVGVVVPPANPAAEPEFQRLLDRRADLHVTRFPVQPGLSLAARLAAYNDVLPEMIRSFGGLPLDALVMACTGSRYLLGPAEDRRDCAELSARFGLPVATATEAIRRALETLRAEEITLVSPYRPWLTTRAERFWTAAGIRITQVVKVKAGARYAPYEVTPDELVARIEEAGVTRSGVLLLTGTGMPTLQAVDALSEGTERTILTSNLCGAWWALTSAGKYAPLDRLGHAERVTV